MENCNVSTKIQFFCFWELRLNKFDWNVIVNIFSVPEKESLTYVTLLFGIHFSCLILIQANVDGLVHITTLGP